MKTDLTHEFRNWFYAGRKCPKSYIGWSNNHFDEIRKEYRLSFGVDNLFEIDLDNREDSIEDIENNLKKKDSSFEQFSDAAQHGIPHAILKKHFINFIRSYRIVNET